MNQNPNPTFKPNNASIANSILTNNPAFSNVLRNPAFNNPASNNPSIPKRSLNQQFSANPSLKKDPSSGYNPQSSFIQERSAMLMQIEEENVSQAPQISEERMMMQAPMMRRNPMNMNYMNRPQVNRVENRSVVLMIAEKPNIAKTISHALCRGRMNQRKGEISKFCNVFEFDGELFGEQVVMRVTSVAGHIYAADFPQAYQDWRNVQPETLFDAPTIKKEISPDNKMVQHLKTEARDVSYLVLWLPNDREGENICFEIIDNVQECMRKESFQQIYRAHFASLAQNDIMEAFRNLNAPPNIAESKAVDVRQIIDLKLGVALSRFQTRHLRKKYPDLNTKLVTYGPCQTPTLGFCVERCSEIEVFRPTQIFKVIVTSVISSAGFKTEIMWDRERTSKPEEAQMAKNEIEASREVTVIDLSNKGDSIKRPEPLNTVELLKHGSSVLGLGPQETMKAAERLYLNGLITYPRTESKTYPQTMNFQIILSKLARNNMFPEFIKKFTNEGLNTPGGSKENSGGDRPPITPTLKSPQAELQDKEAALYEFIVRYFLATISQDAQIMKRQVKFQAGKHKFTLEGTTVLNPGFTQIANWAQIKEAVAPEFSLQGKYQISSVEIKSMMTEPPKYLTESDLISLMEKHHIGTDASMAQHINNICERNFVIVDPDSRQLMPTELGIALILGYKEIDPNLVDPTFRSQIENSINMIAEGKVDYREILEMALEECKEKFKNFMENIHQMDLIFARIFGTYEDEKHNGQPFSHCGQCGNIMTIVEKHHKLFCRTCNKVLTLPQNGIVEAAENILCPLDSFQLVIFTSNNQITSYMLCPWCSNNKSPFNNLGPRVTCNICPEESCGFSRANNTLEDCSVCNQGHVVLNQLVRDRLSASCYYCYNSVLIMENVANVARSGNKCSGCSAFKFIEITTNDNVSYQDVCVFCDPAISSGLQKIGVPTKRRNPMMTTQVIQNQNETSLQGGGETSNSNPLQMKPTESLFGRNSNNNGRILKAEVANIEEMKSNVNNPPQRSLNQGMVSKNQIMMTSIRTNSVVKNSSFIPEKINQLAQGN